MNVIRHVQHRSVSTMVQERVAVIIVVQHRVAWLILARQMEIVPFQVAVPVPTLLLVAVVVVR